MCPGPRPDHASQVRGTVTRRALALVAVLLFFIGCGDGTEADGPGSSAAGEGEPRTGGTLVAAAPSDLGLANPLVARDALTQEVNRHLLFMPLLRYDPELELRPYLAESWDLIGDTAVELRLRDDVRWHDGTPTSAHDVAFTFHRLKEPATAAPLRGHFERWRGVEVVDSFTVRFGFEPHRNPLGALPLVPIAPRHLLDSVPAAEMSRTGFNRDPVGNGPFRFVRRGADGRREFEANTDFPESLGGRPYLDRLVWRVLPETGSQEAALRTGEIDLLLGVRAGRFDELRSATGLRGIVRPSLRYAFIGWNGRREPFGDPRVRRALTMAVDRREILEALRGGQGTLAVGPVPPNHWLSNSSLEPLRHDPDSALALLAETGLRNRDSDRPLEHPSGEELEFVLIVPAQSDFNRDVAQMVQADLSEIGVQMRIRPLDYSALVQRISSSNRTFDAVLMAFEASYDLDVRAQFHSDELGGPFQLASYSNPAVDSILDRLETAPDRSATEELWYRLQEILREEQPWTFLYYFPDLMIARDRVKGIEADIRGMLVSADRWWVEASAGD